MNISRSEIRHVVGPLLSEKKKAHLERLTLLVFPAVVLSEIGFHTKEGTRSEIKTKCLQQAAAVPAWPGPIAPESIDSVRPLPAQLDAVQALGEELSREYGYRSDLLVGWFERAFEFGVEQSRVFNMKSNGLLYDGPGIARQLAMLVCADEKYFAHA